jgi:hypothetical protein
MDDVVCAMAVGATGDILSLTNLNPSVPLIHFRFIIVAVTAVDRGELLVMREIFEAVKVAVTVDAFEALVGRASEYRRRNGQSFRPRAVVFEHGCVAVALDAEGVVGMGGEYTKRKD